MQIHPEKIQLDQRQESDSSSGFQHNDLVRRVALHLLVQMQVLLQELVEMVVQPLHLQYLVLLPLMLEVVVVVVIIVEALELVD